MTPPVTPEIALAMMRQERLTWIERRAEADDKIRTLDAQIAGAVFVLELQAKAAPSDDTAISATDEQDAYLQAQADGCAEAYAESLIADREQRGRPETSSETEA